MPRIRVTTKNATETQKLGFLFGEEIRQWNHSGTRAIVIALSGELGAGKTVFTKGLARGLGVHAHITSPTFVIAKRYALKKSHHKNLWHVDCYRIERQRELASAGIQELLRERTNIIVIEWPERIRSWIPKGAITITLAHGGKNIRQILFSGG